MAIWDVSENAEIEEHFKPFLQKGTYNPKDYNENAPKAAAKEEDFESLSEEEEEAPKKKKKTKKQK